MARVFLLCKATFYHNRHCFQVPQLQLLLYSVFLVSHLSNVKASLSRAWDPTPVAPTIRAQAVEIRPPNPFSLPAPLDKARDVSLLCRFYVRFV